MRQKVWISCSEQRGLDNDITLHETAKGAIDTAVDGLSANQAALARIALDEEGYWQDREDDPRYYCWVREETVQP